VGRRGEIKIADFGLARTWTFDELMPKHLATEYTNMVVTRWYRAPELLLGDRHYGPAVDMWSLGYVHTSLYWMGTDIRCVLGEMYHRLPILQGESDRDQLFKIFGKIERPSEESFPGWDKLPGFPDSPDYPWDKVTEDVPLVENAKRWK
jgi:serine/threonine-protein kinase BUR1